MFFLVNMYIFLIQKHLTKTTEVVFWDLERINGISINFNGENCFEIRAI
jgi:hypothetical protein